MNNIKYLIVSFSLLAFLPSLGLAADVPVFDLKIKNHQFNPAELEVPANQKVKLVIENQDPTPEEFESYDLNREKVVTGGGTIRLYVGPLKPGEYKFFGEFHEDTAQGKIIVR